MVKLDKPRDKPTTKSKESKKVYEEVKHIRSSSYLELDNTKLKRRRYSKN